MASNNKKYSRPEPYRRTYRYKGNYESGRATNTRRTPPRSSSSSSSSSSNDKKIEPEPQLMCALQNLRTKIQNQDMTATQNCLRLVARAKELEFDSPIMRNFEMAVQTANLELVEMVYESGLLRNLDLKPALIAAIRQSNDVILRYLIPRYRSQLQETNWDIIDLAFEFYLQRQDTDKKIIRLFYESYPVETFRIAIRLDAKTIINDLLSQERDELLLPLLLKCAMIESSYETVGLILQLYPDCKTFDYLSTYFEMMVQGNMEMVEWLLWTKNDSALNALVAPLANHAILVAMQNLDQREIFGNITIIGSEAEKLRHPQRAKLNYHIANGNVVFVKQYIQSTPDLINVSKKAVMHAYQKGYIGVISYLHNLYFCPAMKNYDYHLLPESCFLREYLQHYHGNRPHEKMYQIHANDNPITN